MTIDLRKQEGIVPPIALNAVNRVTIVGVGAIGREVLDTFASMGVPRMRLIDHDVIDETNVSTQGWLTDDIGEPKVEMAKCHAQCINPDVEIEAIESKWSRQMREDDDVYVFTVDSISVRKAMFSVLRGHTKLILDARMFAEAVRVLTVHDEESAEQYSKTFFSEEETHQADGCTQPGVRHVAKIAASIIAAQFTKWLRHYPANAMQNDLFCNVLSMTLTNEE